MRFSEWFRRVPQLQDDIVSLYFPGPPEADHQESTDDSTLVEVEPAATEFEVGLADLFLFIDYENAGGIRSSRPITVRKAIDDGLHPQIMAFCHSTKRIKCFRLDRIISITSADGEYFEPPSGFWSRIGFYFGESVVVSKATPDLRYAASLGLKIEVRHRQPEGHRMLPWTDTTST